VKSSYAELCGRAAVPGDFERDRWTLALRRVVDAGHAAARGVVEPATDVVQTGPALRPTLRLTRADRTTECPTTSLRHPRSAGNS
jgi:hypothetical protein